MARLIHSQRAFADLDRPADFLPDSDPAAAAETVDLVTEAITILKRHPMIGHPVDTTIRELIISRGRTGCVALYSLVPGHDAVLILSVRHQREAGCLA